MKHKHKWSYIGYDRDYYRYIYWCDLCGCLKFNKDWKAHSYRKPKHPLRKGKKKGAGDEC
jgi:hypothetical protein